MDWEAREALRDMDDDYEGMPQDTEAFESAPPGQEGTNMSHAGGEFHVFKDLVSELMKFSPYHE
jgi:hypothetical protein